MECHLGSSLNWIQTRRLTAWGGALLFRSHATMEIGVFLTAPGSHDKVKKSSQKQFVIATFAEY